MYESPIFFADLTIRHPDNDNAELLWHCGNFPPSLKDENSETSSCGRHFIMEGGFPGCGEFRIKDGPITIPLSNVATIRRVNIPGEVAHYNIARVNDVYVNVSGRDVGSVAADVEKALAELPEELGVSMTVRGPVTTMKSGVRMLGFGLVVAAILVYLVMLAQFRSFVDPLLPLIREILGEEQEGAG